MSEQTKLQIAEEALRAIVDAWITNKYEDEDYEEGYDDGLKIAHDIASKGLSDMTEASTVKDCLTVADTPEASHD